MTDLSIDAINDELHRLKSQANEMRNEIAHLESGKGAWVSGNPYTAKETEKFIAGARRQLDTYEAMHKAISALVAGKAKYMTAETREVARRSLASCKRLGLGDDSTTERLAADLAYLTKIGGQAASDLAYEIVHKLKCQI